MSLEKDGMLRTTLPNGLEVILVEDHSAPVVALNVWVRVGSGDERDEQWGMAHVHEHMLFKGTERRGVGEIARTVEGAAAAREPHRIAFYLYDLAAEFHALWNMGNDDPARRFLLPENVPMTCARLFLADAIGQVVRNGLAIMGVEAVQELS